MSNTYSKPCRAAVLGASGFAGGELLRILSRHPGIEVVAAAASSQVGKPLAHAYPGLGLDGAFLPVEAALAAEPDVLFASLPHTQSMAVLGGWEGPVAIDLGGDFRLDEPAAYEQWYGEPHDYPEQMSRWTYGLTEWHRAEVSAARRVANPGCYPTASILPLAPLLAAGAITPSGIHIDAQSGVSGAGRASGEGFDFVAVNENLRPYSPTGHKHIAEIEQDLSAVAGAEVVVSFVPHLVPVTRGLLATCSAPLAHPATTPELLAVLHDRYDAEPFVRVLDADRLPETRRVTGTNVAEVTVRVDTRSGRAIAMAAIDNLGKGAAGQAVQNANLMLGFPEVTALDVAGLLP
ncbi:MAG TPA: N-acetyl-gamma-glutamyl-phosphate reductase [Acidimicrobiia bacterium]|nr:N-acetyl-gamma-glutamyl-phosphate reductase [Acidimicrobiia bacterium]